MDEPLDQGQGQGEGPGLREIYLAGGCFWGVEAFMKKLPGVMSTQVGYANGNDALTGPTYEQVYTDATGFAETVHVTFDPRRISLPLLLEAFFSIIDPASVNKQGEDEGTRYRTGIFWTDPADERPVKDALYKLERSLPKDADPVAVEALPLSSFWPAEDYHQDYLDKNPAGYCHVDLGGAERFVAEHERDFAIVAAGYERPDDDALRENLDDLAYAVTQEAATERPWSSDLDQNFQHGIYVDRVTGEPLFSSADKYDSGCGWPAFSKPIASSVVTERADDRVPGRPRVEVRSETGESHLGHVFEDGPEEQGGLRYCINGAALEFIPVEEMDARGYGYLKDAVE